MKKRLAALQIYRDEDEHVVEHHYEAHPPEKYRMTKNKAIGHVLHHMEKLSPLEGAPQLESSEIGEQEDSQPVSQGGRPASFDSGSARLGEIRGRR